MSRPISFRCAGAFWLSREGPGSAIDRAETGGANEAAFDNYQRRLHRSYTAARLGYWDEVRGAVEDTSGWWKQPVLVQRLWRGAEHLRDLAMVRQCMCLLCWDHPTHAPEALRESLHFAAAYRAFGELDEVLEIGDFPAWYALCHRQCLPDVPADNREASLPPSSLTR